MTPNGGEKYGAFFMEIRMNELTTGKTMTVAQVAQALGYKKDTIRKKVKELFPEIVENGIVTVLTEDQVHELKTVLVPRTLALKSEVTSAVLETEMLDKAREVMSWLIVKTTKQEKEIKQLSTENERLQIELDESKKWYSVKRVQIAGHLKNKDPRTLWKPLKEYSINNGYQIKVIIDPNFGNVKTYSADVWKAVYGVELA